MSTVLPTTADISARIAATAERPATATQGEALENSRTALASDFNTFLTLLTAQMKNQDPLKPIESTEFVAQLAQFSGVEQQISTNNKLTSLLEAVTESSTGSLSQWLGQEVRAVAPAPFTGQPVDVYPSAATITAANATLVVRNAAGDVVAEQNFPPGDKAVVWDGKITSGATAPSGSYSFSVRYATARGETQTADAAVYARVTEARRENGEAILVLDGGGTVSAGSVSAVRPPRQPVAPAA